MQFPSASVLVISVLVFAYCLDFACLETKTVLRQSAAFSIICNIPILNATGKF